MYEGNFIDGRLNGRGFFTWNFMDSFCGDYYIGNFVDNDFNGFGIKHTLDNNFYIGNWTSDYLNGIGIQINEDGWVIVSTYKFGKKYGVGAFIKPNFEIHKLFYERDEIKSDEIILDSPKTEEKANDNEDEIDMNFNDFLNL